MGRFIEKKTVAFFIDSQLYFFDHGVCMLTIDQKNHRGMFGLSVSNFLYKGIFL